MHIISFMKIYLFLSVILLTGCFQAHNDDEDLRTVPVTNNPNIIPSHVSMIPGLSE